MNTAAVSTDFSATDIAAIRKEFPVLHQSVNGHPLVYLDNAATTQKPRSVIDAISRYYSEDNANIHRGIHTLAERATRAFEDTRKALAGFIGAGEPKEIVFTRGVTEAINLVAHGFGIQELRKDDEVIVSGLEHHSNIVPWQMACQRSGAHLRVIPVLDNGELDLTTYRRLLKPNITRIVAVNHASNSLGTVNPIAEIIKLAKEAGSATLIDGAQASAHLPIDVRQFDCDFYAVSAHKMYGPTGVGMLYGKRAWLDRLPPYQGGGEMIRDVSFERTTYNSIPYKFEAGTPNIADVVGWKAALDFIHQHGKDRMARYEQTLLKAAAERLATVPGIRFIGTAPEKVSVLSFVLEGIHHFDAGQLLDARGIAVRTGHHCTQPLMQRFGLEGTIRASFAVYNTMEEVDRLAEAVLHISQRKKKES